MQWRIFILSLCFNMSSFALAPQGINPTKQIQQLFYLYGNSTVDLENDTVEVDGFTYKRLGKILYITPEGNRSQMSLDKFLFYRRLGASSFEALAGSGTSVGSAFLIGENLILTNKHVAETDNEERSCGKFSIKFGKEDIACKKVLYCDSHDFCLVEMNQTKEGKNLSELTRPLSLSSKKAVGKSLFLIGNSHGLGVQGSEGKDFKYYDRVDLHGRAFAQKYYAGRLHELDFYAPSLGGSSGSPVFDRTGAVVGINYAHYSPDDFPVGDGIKNHAIPSYYIVSQLKKNLPASVFKKISVDENNLANHSDYIEDWKKAYGSQEPGLQFEELLDCLEKKQVQACVKKVDLNSASAPYSHLPLLEVSRLPSMANAFKSGLIEYENLIARPAVGYVNSSAATKACAALKMFDQECYLKQIAQIVLSKLPHFSKILSFYENEDLSRLFEITGELFQKEESQYYLDLKWVLEKDPDTIVRSFTKCISGIKRIYLKDMLFDGSNTPLYSRSCNEKILEALRDSGYKIGKEFEELAPQVLYVNALFERLDKSFREDVLTEWKVFLNALTKGSKQRDSLNLELLKTWAQNQKIKLDVEEFHQEIAKKMKYFYY